MAPVSASPSLFRQSLAGLGLAGTLVLLVVQLPRLADPGLLGVDDFVEYWSAGRLNLQGGDPYSAAELFRLQKEVGSPHDEAIMMWNPPWTLTVVMPFGVPSYPVARLLWLLLHMGLVLLCADLLWRFYGGPLAGRWLAWLVALSFCPTLVVLRMGQIGPFILLGLVGFVLLVSRPASPFEGRRWPEWGAGAVLVLAALKPHLVYLVWVAWLLWVVEGRRWRVLFGGILAGAGATLIPLLFNPQVLAQYRYATAHEPPVDWITTTFGTLLRVLFGQEKRWLQFVPTLLGLVWFLPYWLAHRRRWDWKDQLPLLLLVSFSTASFGWLGDQVVLLLPLLQMAAWLAQLAVGQDANGAPSRQDRNPAPHKAGATRQPMLVLLVVGVYLLLDVLDLCLNIFFHDQQLWHLWTAPTLLIGYLALRAHVANGKCEPKQSAVGSRQ